MTEVWGHEGGIQQVNRSLIRFFSNLMSCNQVTVLIMLDSQDVIDVALAGQSIPPHIKIYGYSANKTHFYLAILKFMLFHRPQLVYMAHIYLVAWGVLCKLLGIKYFFMAYGIDVWSPLSFLKRLGVRLADSAISISEHTKTKACNIEPVFQKLQVCYPGLNINTIIYHQERHQKLIQSFNNRKIILTVGRIDAGENYKGHAELLIAVQYLQFRHPDLLLVIVGRGSGLSQLQKQVVKMGIANLVDFAGFVPDDLLPSYYTLCDIFAMPSRGEGFGLVYLEAMAHRKPCIGSIFDAAGEIIVDGDTGFLVNPDNVPELIDRLNRLLDAPELRTQMGQAGRQRYETLFTEDKFHQRFLNIIYQIIED